MPKSKKTDEQVEPTLDQSNQLVNALVEAIKLTRPEEKKNPFNRPIRSPWAPPDGQKKLKLRRKMYQHGILIDPDLLDNETIDALNRLKVGRFLDGWVKVFKRKDSGIDIDYPVKTANQRMKLAAQYGVHSLKALCDKCIEEAKNPKPEPTNDDE